MGQLDSLATVHKINSCNKKFCSLAAHKTFFKKLGNFKMQVTNATAMSDKYSNSKILTTLSKSGN